MEHRKLLGQSQSYLLSKLHIKNVIYGWTQRRFYSYTINLFIFIVKHEESFFGGYVKEITKIMLWDVRGILIVIVQVVNTNIDGFF